MIKDYHWDFDALKEIFRGLLDSPILRMEIVDSNAENHWVWSPSSSTNRIVPSIYSFYNQNGKSNLCWEGWRNIWNLRVASRAKFYTWLVMHNRVKTMTIYIPWA